MAAAGQAEIYKCTDEDGNIMYSQLPCENEKPVGTVSADSNNPSTDDNSEDELTEQEEDEDTEIPVAAENDSTQSEAVAECKKRYRDAIDEIDAELSRDFQPEQADAYKQRLLELTRKLRQC